MFDTERNQPIRVWAVASGFSMRTLGIANGTLITPIPSSRAASWLASASKVDMSVGATLRWSHATGFPRASRPASRCSTETVWKYVWCRSSSRVHVTFTGLPSIACDSTAASIP